MLRPTFLEPCIYVLRRYRDLRCRHLFRGVGHESCDESLVGSCWIDITLQNVHFYRNCCMFYHMRDIASVREICHNSHRFSCFDIWDVPVLYRVLCVNVNHVDHLCVVRLRSQETYRPGPLLVFEILQQLCRCRLLSLKSGPFHVKNVLLSFGS